MSATHQMMEWTSILDGSAHNMHVGLANRKWVNVIRFEVTKTVVDETVCAFIRAHGVKDVLDRRVFRKTPVVLGDGGCCHLFPVCPRSGSRVAARDQDLRTIWGDGPVRAPRLRAY